MSHDTWIHRIARILVRPLVRTPVTPNQITTARLATGLAAAAAFGAGTSGWAQTGAGLFLVSMLLDRADGELARLAGKSSRWGHVYDLIVDAVVNALTFVGIGVGLVAGGWWNPVLGIVAGVAVAGALVLVLRVERERGHRAGELRGAWGFDPDDAMVVVPVAMALGAAETLLWASALGAPLFTAYLILRLRARRVAALGTIRRP